jgi:hypothetical protein
VSAIHRVADHPTGVRPAFPVGREVARYRGRRRRPEARLAAFAALLALALVSLGLSLLAVR